MENNEIMNNIEEVAAEMNDVAVVDESKGLGLVGGVLATAGFVVAMFATYKAVKWVGKKIKAKKAAKAAECEVVEADFEECDETVED